MTMSPRIAIFIDAENLTSWLKHDGLESLMEELLPLGQIVVRRAYGKWSEDNLVPLQAALNENGFELVHTYHPVSGKNSTDIKMTVDTMDVAADTQVQWIVLATGDSDFSPLFRKLREQGKDVIGVGPKSPLSECVKNSCSRYIYTDEVPEVNDDAGDVEKSKEVDVAEKIDSMEMLHSALQKFEEPIHLSKLKSMILSMDNAFSEKRVGFKTFKEFVLSADFAEVNDDGNGTITVALAKKKVEVNEDAKMVLAKVLKRKGWDMFSKSLIRKVYRLACEKSVNSTMTKQDLIQVLLAENIVGTTSGIINRILGIFYKAHLVTVKGDAEKLWTVNNTNQYWREIDKAMLDRLKAGLAEENLQVTAADIATILYGTYADGEAEKIVEM